MKTLTFGAVALLASLSLAVAAQASTFVIAYPSSSTSYDSATNGSGTIPSGGQSAYMWTAGDNISQTFTGTGLASVNAFNDSFQIQNVLYANETVDVSINSVVIGSFTALACGGCGTDQTVNFSSSFAALTGSGTYTITMTLQDTIPGGDGSIAFLNGGAGSLVSGGVPEPAAWALMLLGFGGLGAVLRRRRIDAGLAA